MKRTWIVAVLILLLALAGAVKHVWDRSDLQAEAAQREWAIAHVVGAMNCMAFWDWRDGLGSQAEVVDAGYEVEKMLVEVPQLRSVRDALVAIEDYRPPDPNSDELIATAARECSDAGVSHEKALTFRNTPSWLWTNGDR